MWVYNVPHWCTRLLIFLELMAKQALYAKVQKKLFSSQKALLVWKEFFKRHDYRAAHKSIQSVFTGSQNLSFKKMNLFRDPSAKDPAKASYNHCSSSPESLFSSSSSSPARFSQTGLSAATPLNNTREKNLLSKARARQKWKVIFC